MNKPIIAVTMGDPAGIGPEIVVRAMQERDVRASCNPIVIGDPKILIKAANMIGSKLLIEPVSTAAAVGNNSSVCYVIPSGELNVEELKPGTLNAQCGESAAACCRRSVGMAKAGEVDAIVSTPFNKEAFHMAGYRAVDDMSYFQQCFGGSKQAYMVGEVAGLWITMVTYHVPFRSIADMITEEAVLEKIHGLFRVMKLFGVSPIRIGVAGLNVHSGEGGIYGNEEIDKIIPAIEKAKAEGSFVVGPVPPDSLFLKALQGDYTGLVCMYHDQANIGRKILGRDNPGTTLYMGMEKPVLTVPHGTAYDIAWLGKANHTMLARAIKVASAIVRK